MKQLLAITACLCLLFTLSACGKSNSIPADSAGNAAQADSSAVQDSAVPDVSSVLNANTQPFALITVPEMTVYGSGNDKGFYEIFQNEDQSRNIMYSDYTTCNQIYLCSQPNCAHDNESCTSWIAPCAGNVYPAAIGDKLFIVYSLSDQKSFIEVRDANGSNANTLCEFASGDRIEVGVFANDKRLVVNVLHLDANTGYAPVYNLTAIDMATGAQQTIYSEASQSSDVTSPDALTMFFMGVTKGSFIVKTVETLAYETVPDNDEATTENMINAVQSRLVAVPFDGTPAKEIFTFKPKDVFEEPRGGYLFYIKNNDDATVSFHKLDAETGEDTVLVPDFRTGEAADLLAQTEFSDYVIRDAVGEYVFLNVFCESHTTAEESVLSLWRRLAINTENGSIREIALPTSYYGMTMPVQTVDQFDDTLLVHYKIDEVPQGPKQMPVTQRSLGLISLSDYVSSTPNYREITASRKAM